MTSPVSTVPSETSGCLRMPIRTRISSPGASREILAGATVSAPIVLTQTVRSSSGVIQASPRLVIVASTACAPSALGNSFDLDLAPRRTMALPLAIGCIDKANMCRLDLFGRGGLVIGKVKLTGSLVGSNQICPSKIETGCGSVPPGLYRYGAWIGPPPPYQSAA